MNLTGIVVTMRCKDGNLSGWANRGVGVPFLRWSEYIVQHAFTNKRGADLVNAVSGILCLQQWCWVFT